MPLKTDLVRLLLPCVIPLIACYVGVPPRSDAFASGLTSVSAGQDTDGTTADGSSTSGPSASSGSVLTGTSAPEPGPKFDLGAVPDAAGTGGEAAEGCAKIDFVFVVDNSGSMAEEQAALTASFPGFIQSIQDTVKAQDYQILTIDTDEGFGVACDATLGAGIAESPEGFACGVVGGNRYMLPSQPALADTFACVATVGVNGDSEERPMEAMVEAVTTQSGPGTCNSGFLRPDAILVVTFISDEEDVGKSAGDPTSWRDALVAAKGGDEQAIVALGLIGGDGSCPDAEFSPNLKTFAESFTFGSWGPICAPSYAPFFDQAVMVIDNACDIFVPG